MNPEIKRPFDRQHILGTVFIAIAIVMVIQGLWLSHVNDKETACQAAYNESYTAVVQQRGEWADEDRAALNKMIFTVIDPKTTQAQAEEAVQLYAETAKKNDANRKENPLPDRTSCS